MWQQLLSQIQQGSIKALARCISLVENEHNGFDSFLQSLPYSSTPVTGITGAPGAGKSTLVDALVEELVNQNKRVGIVCVDPSSPFNLGALLGDRIRMNKWYNHPNVFIRSLATRGSLGGLHPKIIEITDTIKLGSFDEILVETVGVGQSEIDIVGLADTTVLVVVPEGGDEVQTMKSGIMEVADIFVVNKADREGAEKFVTNLHKMLSPVYHSNPVQKPVIKTIASEKQGIPLLLEKITWHHQQQKRSEKYHWLLAEKAYHIIQQKRMKDVSREMLRKQIEQLSAGENFNIYRFAETYTQAAFSL